MPNNKEKNIRIGWAWWIFLNINSFFTIKYITSYYLNNNLNYDQNKVVILAMIYTIVCGLRSAFPKKDVEGICFFDNILSRPLFGRTIATIAELCYITLIIIIMKYILNDIGLKYNIIDKLFYFIVIAQLCSWKGCLSKNNLWNTTEESIWMITFIIITFINISIYQKISISENTIKNNMIISLLKIVIPFCILFIGFLITVDIPMYIRRWKKNPNPKQQSLITCMKDLNKIKQVSKSYQVWKEDIPWQTGYFTFGVWSAIGLAIWYNNYSKTS